MVDIMKLEGLLSTGRIEDVSGKKATIITPVFRLRFPVLVEPTDYQDDGKYRYRVKMLFNGEKPDAPAFVDMRNVVGDALAKVAASNNVNLKARGGEANPFTRGVIEDKEGEPYDGFEEWTQSATASRHPGKGQAHTDSRFRVQCVSASGQPADPSMFYDGCYCRAMIDIYKNRKNALSIGLKWIQFVADGPRLGANDNTEYSVPAVPGAEDMPVPDSGADAADPNGIPF